MKAARALETFLNDIAALDDPAIFLFVGARDRLITAAEDIDHRPADQVPLRGLIFAVKDNIDVAGMPTTAACPGFAYVPQKSAPVVQQLVDAGALVVAKTNMDQFATGLVGARSPHGTPRNPLAADHVPGGSSSGSGVAVARGLVDFALGTDTAGSGRVPAAFCGVVGLKPTVGRLSIRGVIPAVQSVDCVSIFSRDVATAAAVLHACSGFEVADPFSRVDRPTLAAVPVERIRLGVLGDHELEALGADEFTRKDYAEAVGSIAELADEIFTVDFAPLAAIGDLLYGGPWVAERTAAVGDFIDTHVDDAAAAIDPTVASIIQGGRSYGAVDAYQASYRLAALRREAESALAGIDVLLLPTVPHGALLSEVEADPVGMNSQLGRFTTFVNLIDYCGISLPTGTREDSLLRGSVSLYGRAWSEPTLLELAARFSGEPVDTAANVPADATEIQLVVAGAHLKGQPLEHQLADLGATWVTTTQTAPNYRLYALAGSSPAKPGLVHTADGVAVEVDIWRLSSEALGRFLLLVPAPLALGSVVLADGSERTGFVCEPRGLEGALDVTHHGGWRTYRASCAV